MSDDPYHDSRPRHKAAKIRNDGAVSPVCADPPRAVNLTRETWTLRWEAVTCPKCLAQRPATDTPTEPAR